MDIKSSVITYTVDAVSTGTLLTVGAYSFKQRFDKPSDVIKELLYNPRYGLTEVFYGMKNKSLVNQENLILSDDKAVNIDAKTNISVLDYLTYLVNCMSPYDSSTSTLVKNSIYTLTVIDDTSGKFNGPYFKIIKSNQANVESTAYNIDIGFPSQNIITNFRIDDDENYSIYYNFLDKLNTNQYVQRINDNGEIEEIYAPLLSSGNSKRTTSESEKSWWTKVTEYPIKASITLKGLIRPAILMTHVRLNVYFYGRKHISSGLYIITKQVDNISENGFSTTLNLTRIDKSLPSV